MADLSKVLHLQWRFHYIANRLYDIWMCFPVKPAREIKMVLLSTFQARELKEEKSSNRLDIDWKSFHM